jgi:probable HAF family extracellular repeat protein
MRSRGVLAVLALLAACKDAPLPSEPHPAAIPARSPAPALHDANWVQSSTGVEMLEIGQLDGRSTTPTAINDWGQVVGYYSADTPLGQRQQAFVWENGNFTPLGTLGGTVSLTTFISNLGVIVGLAFNADERARPVIWRRGLGGWTIRELPGLVDFPSAFGHARSMNIFGEIVGAYLSTAGQQHAVRWGPDGPVDLGVLEGTDFSDAFAINASGTILGMSVSFSPFASHPTVWKRRGAPARQMLPNDGNFAGQNMDASQTLNERGDFIGTYTIQSPFEVGAFVSRGGTIQTLAPLVQLPFTTFTVALGLNEWSDVAGWSTTFNGPRAVVWPRTGEAPVDLGVASVGGNFSRAHSINNWGLVVGESATFTDGVFRVGGAIWRYRKPQ